MTQFLQRVCRYLLIVLLLAGSFSAVLADAPMVKTQVPGYYRMMLGQFEVTALYDGSIDLDVNLFHNASKAQIKRLLDRKFVDTPKMQTPVNAYLVNTGTKLVLIDSGAAKVFGPTLGSVLRNLKAAGYDPSQVDVVLITHLHGDHIGGLLDAAGKLVFPNANVYINKADNDFWLSTDIAKKAPTDAQAFFKMARDISAPYITSGKWKTFENGYEPVPGIKAITDPGHTPGHTVYEINSNNQTLVILGDTVHSAAVQFARPTVSCDFDTNQKQAISSRLALFRRIEAKNAIIAGMHLPFPGIGRIHIDGKDTYTWVPIEYSPIN